MWEEGKNGTLTNSIGSNVYNMENSSYLQWDVGCKRSTTTKRLAYSTLPTHAYIEILSQKKTNAQLTPEMHIKSYSVKQYIPQLGFNK